MKIKWERRGEARTELQAVVQAEERELAAEEEKS